MVVMCWAAEAQTDTAARAPACVVLLCRPAREMRRQPKLLTGWCPAWLCPPPPGPTHPHSLFVLLALLPQCCQVAVQPRDLQHLNHVLVNLRACDTMVCVCVTQGWCRVWSG